LADPFYSQKIVQLNVDEDDEKEEDEELYLIMKSSLTDRVPTLMKEGCIWF